MIRHSIRVLQTLLGVWSEFFQYSDSTILAARLESLTFEWALEDVAVFL